MKKNINRLTQAAYASNSEQWNGDLLAMNDRNFSCTYAYDLNSNMTALQRYGVDLYNTSLPTHIRNHGMIDNLTMTYDGNRLKKVTDQCEELSYAGAMDFKDGADKDEEYTYDANGNMTCDRNKGIHSITYNMLNLPETVLFNDGHETRYTYAADGRKLRTEYRLNNFAIIEADEAAEEADPATFSLPSVGGVIDEPIELEPTYTTLMTRDYCGNYIYSNGILERILTDNGYIQGDEYYFYIKDYQGNIRVVLNQNNQPVELNSYYPYGALMAATATEGIQPYKYSAKELDRENGLDLYDSQARHYDPIIPRTTTMDPLAEKYYSLSPYTWCAGNPLRYIDFDGRDNYQVDSLGYISLIQKNSDAFDRIYAISDQTTPNYINVDKSFMASEKTEMIKQKSSLYGNGKVKVSTYCGVDANQVYYFMRDHTLVEWTLVNNTYIGTCHDRNKDATASYLFEELINNNQAISEMRHIHPGGGKAVSQGDSEVAKKIQNYFPSAKLYIDIPSKFGGVLFKEYDQYDIVGLLEEVVCEGQKVRK